MGKIGRWGTRLVLGAAMVLGSSSARAGYVVSVVDSNTGMSSATLAPGESITLDLQVISDSEDVSNAFTLTAFLSASGLEYDDYSLGAPYVAGGPGDFTAVLGIPVPPTVLGSMIGWAASAPLGTEYGSGALVTFGLTVPADWFARGGNPDVVTITYLDTFYEIVNGFEAIPFSAGAPFTLNIPEPATLALLAVGGLAIVRRRKKA